MAARLLRTVGLNISTSQKLALVAIMANLYASFSRIVRDYLPLTCVVLYDPEEPLSDILETANSDLIILRAPCQAEALGDFLQFQLFDLKPLLDYINNKQLGSALLFLNEYAYQNILGVSC